MRLPNGNHAVVDIAKLQEYCLNANPRVGRFKARVFASALGLAVTDAPVLANWLLETSRNQEALIGRLDGHGQRYLVDFSATNSGRAAIIRS